jgi:predicted dehydrogenase
MDERPIRLGYVGAGFIAQSIHLPNFAALPGCRLLALAEVRRDLGERVAARHGIPRLYPDHHALAADSEVDAIAVSAPYALQGEIARDCLAAGKHVFIEKPLAVSLAQAERILAAGAAGRARLMVAMMKRYDPGNELAQAIIADWRRTGTAGPLTYVRAHNFAGDWIAGLDVPLEGSAEPPPPAPTAENLPDWLPPERAESYVNYLQQYVHNLDLLRFLLGAGDRARVRHADLDPDGHTGVVTLEVDGVRCLFESGHLRCHRLDDHTQAYFERGWVRTLAPPPLLRNSVADVEVYRWHPEGVPGLPGVQHTLTRPQPEPRWAWPYKREAEHFIECVRTGAAFRSPGDDALTDVRLFEEIYRTWLQR